MRNKNLDESLQTAARDLVETPDYLEDLVMWVYESKGRVAKSELIGDSMCPKSVRKYLKDGGTIKELLKEAQEAAICRMSEAEECICMQNVQLARLFLKTSKSSYVVKIPFTAIETAPVSSETTTTTASEFSLIPSAALCLVPRFILRRLFLVSGKIHPPAYKTPSLITSAPSCSGALL